MKYIADIKALKETKDGTLLKIFVPKVYLDCKLLRMKTDHILIEINDDRTITPYQRKKYYANLNDIAIATGHQQKELHDYFKSLYHNKFDGVISLTDCTVTQAKDLITLQVEFMFDLEIAVTDKMINRVEDINKYLYLCLMQRKCCICGKRADIHHALGFKIGMGNDRTQVNHVGRKAIALCREHHTQIESGSEQDFLDKHKVYAIELDEVVVKKLKL